MVKASEFRNPPVLLVSWSLGLSTPAVVWILYAVGRAHVGSVYEYHTFVSTKDFHKTVSRYILQQKNHYQHLHIAPGTGLVHPYMTRFSHWMKYIFPEFFHSVLSLRKAFY